MIKLWSKYWNQASKHCGWENISTNIHQLSASEHSHTEIALIQKGSNLLKQTG